MKITKRAEVIFYKDTYSYISFQLFQSLSIQDTVNSSEYISMSLLNDIQTLVLKYVNNFCESDNDRLFLVKSNNSYEMKYSFLLLLYKIGNEIKSENKNLSLFLLNLNDNESFIMIQQLLINKQAIISDNNNIIKIVNETDKSSLLKLFSNYEIIKENEINILNLKLFIAQLENKVSEYQIKMDFHLNKAILYKVSFQYWLVQNISKYLLLPPPSVLLYKLFCYYHCFYYYFYC